MILYRVPLWGLGGIAVIVKFSFLVKCDIVLNLALKKQPTLKFNNLRIFNTPWTFRQAQCKTGSGCKRNSKLDLRFVAGDLRLWNNGVALKPFFKHLIKQQKYCHTKPVKTIA